MTLALCCVPASTRLRGRASRGDLPTGLARTALEAQRERLIEKSAKPFDQPDEAMAFYLAQRLPPGAKEIPLERLHAASLEIANRERALRDESGTDGDILGWTSIGPGNIGGRTRSIVIDPTNPQVMYASGVSGGVWKSTDGGTSWNPTDDLMLNLAVSALAIDPTNPNVLYAGTGEGFYPGLFVRGLGIFKTVDGGGTWTQLGATVSPSVGEGFYWVNEIFVSPNAPDRVYAGTRHGVWRSLDGGQSWTLVLANPTYATAPYQSQGSSVGCTDMAVRTDRNPDVLFAAFGSFEADGLFRSDDGGSTWLRYTTGSYQGRMSIAIAPSDNDVIYIAMADNGGQSGLGRIVSVFKSTDGANFTAVLDPNHPFSPWLMSYSSIATGCVQAPVVYSQGWYDNVIAVDPVNADVVWLGGIDLFRSDDGGRTFGMAGYWFYYMLDPTPPTYLHPDQHGIVFHPHYDGVSNQTLYVTNDGGLFRTTNARAATTQEECPIGPDPGPPPEIAWQSLNHGYGVTQFYHGDAGQDGALFAGGAQDNGTASVRETSTPNGWRRIFGGDGGYVAIDPTDSDRMFIEIQGFPEIRRSTDGGATFTKVVSGITDTDGLFITPFAMDPTNPDVLWTGGTRPWRTTDGAQSWQVAGPNFAGPGTISAIAIAPSNPSVVYVGFDNGYVMRSINALDAAPSWHVFTNGLYGGWVSSVAVHPTDADAAYLTYSTYYIPHVLRTRDGGQSWESIDGIELSGVPDIPAHWIAVRECDPRQLYVGTELGVFASDDDGATWTPSNQGLAHTVVETLDFKDENTLVAFTHGRGAFVTALAPCGGSPGEASQGNVPGEQMRALSYDRGTGAIDVTYTPACAASEHTIYYGPLSSVATYGYSGAACDLGVSGSASFDPGAASFFFLIVGNNGVTEGSYGVGNGGTERPEDTLTPACDLPQDLTATCD